MVTATSTFDFTMIDSEESYAATLSDGRTIRVNATLFWCEQPECDPELAEVEPLLRRWESGEFFDPENSQHTVSVYNPVTRQCDVPPCGLRAAWRAYKEANIATRYAWRARFARERDAKRSPDRPVRS